MSLRVRVWILCLSASLVSTSNAASQALPHVSDRGPKLWRQLLDRHDYFGLRDALQAGAEPRSILQNFYEAVVSSKFNHPQEAQAKFRKVLDSHIGERYKAKAHDYLGEIYVRQGQYAKAADEFREITKHYAGTVSKADLKDYVTTAAMFSSLAATPPTRRDNGSPDVLRVVRNSEQFVTNGLEINGIPVRFGFDTGANFSICSESQAEALKLREIKQPVNLTTINEKSVAAQFRVAEVLSIGGARVHDVVFLVIPDESMRVSGMEGAIGFPVMAAFRSTVVVFSDEHAQPAGNDSELVFDGLNLLVTGKFAGERATFQLDTGASHTDLYPRFREILVKSGIKPGPVSNKSSTGVGGSSTIKVQRLPAGRLEIAGRLVRIDDAPLWLNANTEASKNFDGNLGYDVFKQLGAMVIDLKSMKLTSGEMAQHSPVNENKSEEKK